MRLTASPLSSRQTARVVPASPGTKPTQRRLYDSDDPDELADDSIVCSSPYFTQPTQIVKRAAQPTQIVHRTSLKETIPIPSSSPRSIVEVPASSPFQQKPTPKPALVRGRIASLMAPAGTTFRPPPPAAPAKTIPAKREAVVIDDSDDDFSKPQFAPDSSDDEGSTTMRGAIRPSSFARRGSPSGLAPPPAKKPRTDEESRAQEARNALAERRLDQQLKRLKPKVGSEYSDQTMRAALRASNMNTDLAIDFLIRRGASQPSPAKSSPMATPPPKIRSKGKLVRGLRPQRSPASSPSFATPTAAAKNNALDRVIDLVSDGEDDDFPQGAASPQTVGDDSDVEASSHDKRLLGYLNTCTADQLASMCKLNKDTAELMVSRRPFETLHAAESVTTFKGGQSGKTKSKKVRVGEDVVEALGEYVHTLEAIEQVIAACDERGVYIKSIIERWDVDQTGKKFCENPSDSQPMTPSSIDEARPSKLVGLPVPAEPAYLQGHCNMKNYQLYGLNWMSVLYKQGFGCILADDMGLGKTCQVISFLAHIIEDFEKNGAEGAERPWPNLIVVPPSTLSNWENEFEKFAPDLKVTAYHGSQYDRDGIAQDILDNPEEHHVILTSYSQLGREQDVASMRAIGPNAAIFDEGHKLKNSKAKVYKDLSRVRANWKLLLTGTPIQNNIMEMITLLSFIQPKLFGAHMENLQALFDQRISLRDVSGGALLLSDRVSRARTILEPFILQRRKQQVLTALPPKTSRVVYCDLDETQKPIYESYESQFRKGKDAKAPRARQPGRQNDQNNTWIQLRKSAIHSQLFRRYFDDKKVEEMAGVLMRKVPQRELQQPNMAHLINELKDLSDFGLHLWCRDYPCIARYDVPEDSWMESGKVKALLGLIGKFQKKGDRVLVFTRFAKVIDILSEVLTTAAVGYRVLQGMTDVGERQEIIDEFTEDTSITAFLLTTGAGGTGINLTAANKVVIFDQSDNPQDDIQAENRAHRLGQTRDVEVIRLITRGTVEELVYLACAKKIELANQVTGWSGEEDGEKTAKEVEREVHRLLLEQRAIVTPPKSDDETGEAD